jgi:uncharacterized protein (TIGR03083 family)
VKPVGRIDVAHLFPELEAKLVELLRGLAPDDWRRPTSCALWSVHDVAAHLLDSALRRLSVQRDGHRLPPPPEPIAGWPDLVAYLDRLNAEWVTATRRLSPRVLTELIADTAPRLCELVAGLDPEGPAIFGVAWAGEEESPNWFDVAREYTERWHHQQQIRDAVGRPGIDSRRLFHPVLDAFVRALPHRYRLVEAPDGARVEVEIAGEAGGVWTLAREGGGWRLYAGAAPGADATVGIDQDSAWKLLTKGLDPAAAEARATVAGDRRLAEPFFGTVAIMG